MDWVSQVVESLLALGFAFVVFYWGWRVLFGRASQDELRLIKEAAENWKIIVLLLVPLFFRTVRIFLEEVREWAGMKRQPRRELQEDEETKARR